MATLGPRIQQIVDALLSDALPEGRGEVDMMDALAAPLPSIVIAELLGVPAEDHRQFKEWASMLVNAIGFVAEAAYHHPDLSVTWGRVTVKLSTHSAGGITDKDFELARRIEETVLWRPQGGALEGTPNKFVRSGDPR